MRVCGWAAKAGMIHHAREWLVVNVLLPGVLAQSRMSRERHSPVFLRVCVGPGSGVRTPHTVRGGMKFESWKRAVPVFKGPGMLGFLRKAINFIYFVTLLHTAPWPNIAVNKHGIQSQAATSYPRLACGFGTCPV